MASRRPTRSPASPRRVARARRCRPRSPSAGLRWRTSSTISLTPPVQEGRPTPLNPRSSSAAVSVGPSVISSRPWASMFSGMNSPSLPPFTLSLRPLGNRNRMPSALPAALLIGNDQARCLGDQPTPSRRKLSADTPRATASRPRASGCSACDSGLPAWPRRACRRWVRSSCVWPRESTAATVPTSGHRRVEREASRLHRSVSAIRSGADSGVGVACIARKQAPIDLAAHRAGPALRHSLPSRGFTHRLALHRIEDSRAKPNRHTLALNSEPCPCRFSRQVGPCHRSPTARLFAHSLGIAPPTV